MKKKMVELAPSKKNGSPSITLKRGMIKIKEKRELFDHFSNNF